MIIGPFEVLECVSKVSYRLVLPLVISKVHDVFDVSMLCKYIHDPSYIIQHLEVKYAPVLREEIQPV